MTVGEVDLALASIAVSLLPLPLPLSLSLPLAGSLHVAVKQCGRVGVGVYFVTSIFDEAEPMKHDRWQTGPLRSCGGGGLSARWLVGSLACRQCEPEPSSPYPRDGHT